MRKSGLLGKIASVLVFGALILVLVLGVVLTRPQTLLPASSDFQSVGNASAAATSHLRTVDVSMVDVKSVRRIGDCCATFFAPDGDRYISVNQDGALWLYSLSGAPQEKLADNVAAAAWTPDGKSLVLSKRIDDTHANAQVLDMVTRQTKDLGATNNPWRIIFDNQGEVVFATESGFQIKDLVSGKERGVIASSLVKAQLGNDSTEIKFSPDGRRLAVLEGTALSIVDRNQRQKTKLTDKIDARRWLAFDWSSDGSQLAYSIVVDDFQPELWVASADGSAAHRVLAQPAGNAGIYVGITYLPGTNLIAYEFIPHGSDGEQTAQYQVISVLGGQPKTLFTNGLGFNLSPDGHIISFVRDLPGKDEVGYWIAELSY